MRKMTSIGVGLTILAVLVLGYAVLDGPVPGPWLAEDAAAAEVVELPVHPIAHELVARRVWSGDDVGILGTPSPDGRWLSYVDWAGGGNLGVRDLRTGESRLLTDKEPGWATSDYALYSVFSRDGSRIAFQWWNPESWEHEIRIAQVEDGSVRTIYAPGNSAAYVEPKAWSPDDRRLLVLRIQVEGRTHEIGFMDVDDGAIEVVESLQPRSLYYMDLSPDGQWIAYSVPRVTEPDVQDVYLLAADGSEKVRLTGSDASEEVVGWLPDGGPLFYLRHARGSTRLVAQELDGGTAVGDPRVVRSDMIHTMPMGAFRDGFLFSVAVDTRQTRLSSIDLDADRLTSPLTPIVPSRMERAGFPTWSADGEHLLYVINPPFGGSGTPADVAVRSVRTGAERRFTIPFTFVFKVAPSPDGGELLVQGSGPRGGQGGIYRMPLGAETVEPVALNGIDALYNRRPEWSADGSTIYYSRVTEEDPDREAIVARDAETGAEREVYVTSGHRFRGFSVSPDGSEIAVAAGDPGSPGAGELVVVDLATGTERELVSVPASQWIGSGSQVTWSPDGEHILYVQEGPDSDGAQALRVIHRTGGEPRVIRTDTRVSWPRIHPDGRRIVLMAGTNRWEVWTLEGLRAAAESR